MQIGLDLGSGWLGSDLGLGSGLGLGGISRFKVVLRLRLKLRLRLRFRRRPIGQAWRRAWALGEAHDKLSSNLLISGFDRQRRLFALSPSLGLMLKLRMCLTLMLRCELSYIRVA